MKQFHLEITCPEGKMFEGNAEKVVADTPTGPVCILAGHINYCTRLTGGLRITADKKERRAKCMDGILTVTHGKAVLVTTHFDWD